MIERLSDLNNELMEVINARAQAQLAISGDRPEVSVRIDQPPAAAPADSLADALSSFFSDEAEETGTTSSRGQEATEPIVLHWDSGADAAARPPEAAAASLPPAGMPMSSHVAPKGTAAAGIGTPPRIQYSQIDLSGKPSSRGLPFPLSLTENARLFSQGSPQSPRRLAPPPLRGRPGR